jgi:Uri superfamily endonuclease
VGVTAADPKRADARPQCCAPPQTRCHEDRPAPVDRLTVPRRDGKSVGSVQAITPAGVDLAATTGTYLLLLSNPRTAPITIGKRLRLTLDEGCYLYVGSAFGPGGLDARLRRHQRGDGRRHWHVDYLRAATTFVGAIVDRGGERREHQWAAELEACGKYAAIAGFGCSDCRCPTHLFHAACAPGSLADLLSGAPRWWRPPR